MTIEQVLSDLMPPFEPSGGGWDDVLNRARRARRRYALIAVAALALLLVPTSVALRSRITDLFEGTPPPPAVSQAFETNNKMADQATQSGFESRFPHAVVAEAHGVLEVQTSDGPEDLWVAPNDQGGTCYFIDWADDPDQPAGKFGLGGCGRSSTDRPSSNIEVSWVWVDPHPALLTLYGRVLVPAASVEVVLEDGSTRKLPVVEGYFLGSLERAALVEHVRAFDALGAEVATWSKPE
jgi:hypothetical protein